MKLTKSWLNKLDSMVALHRYALKQPNETKSKKQQRLKKKHGTPKEFALACYECVGEISVDEAHDAIIKYTKEWNKP